MAAFNRPRDVLAVLDGVESLFPANSVDSSQAAVVGHSFGGLTAIDAGLSGDARVKAVVSLAPVYQERVENLNRPFLFLTGDSDQVLPPSDHALPYVQTLRQRQRANPRRPPTLWANFGDTAHNSFTDVCAFRQGLVRQVSDPFIASAVESSINAFLGILDLQIGRVCPDESIVDYTIVNGVTSMYTVSFLKFILGTTPSNTESTATRSDFEALLGPRIATPDGLRVTFEAISPLRQSTTTTTSTTTRTTRRRRNGRNRRQQQGRNRTRTRRNRNRKKRRRRGGGATA